MQAAESATAAAANVMGHPHSSGNLTCSADGNSRPVTTGLADPLGARVVVDAVSRAAAPITPGHPPR
jgi:hypothetical protein